MNESNWISIVRERYGERDTSSLLIDPDGLQIIGNLAHATIISPNTVEDAKKMIAWLEKWVADSE